jgi:class 3 adenylate cyclase
VNLAARIETACTPGEIYVSQEVRELLHDEPSTALAGDFELKGIEGKTSLYKLVKKRLSRNVCRYKFMLDTS